MNTMTQPVQHKVLIANRGEIAVRIIRACKDCALSSIAIYADPDADALFVRMADEAWALSGVSATETYLHMDKILHIARRAGATMLHPGYGFLSERADFARAVQAAGLIWIGPDPDTIGQLGDKVQARKIALSCGAPLVKGSAGPLTSAAEAIAFARTCGLPIAIKAAFGGGGRGLKVAWQLTEIEPLYHLAVAEAKAAFGRGECYVEQYLDCPRHIEAQILADQHGNMVVAGTRDCTLQRRNQKLVEEAPAPFISDSQRQTIHQAAYDICRSAGYTGAGTVEFLLSRDGKLSFLEVNTRLQVEHPVTEETSSIDLVTEQLRIALGFPLSIKQTPQVRGHAIEFRINCEDPGRGFLPASGVITRFIAPSGPGIRLDSGVDSGSLVPASYDSMIAKLVVSAPTREQAIARARRALAEFTIEGVASVLPFHRAVLTQPEFTEELRVHTRWIETELAERLAFSPCQPPHTDSPLIRRWIELDGRRVSLGLPEGLFAVPSASAPQAVAENASACDDNGITAPVSGLLHHWLAEQGAMVHEGQTIAVMEAMKMELQIQAPATGKLQQQVAAGKLLEQGQRLGVIDKSLPPQA